MRVAIVCVVVLVALAGCFGTELTASDSDVGNMGPANPADAGAGQAQVSGEPSGLNASAQRSVVRTGIVHSQVPDFDAARENLTTTIRTQGGYVSDSTERTVGSTETRHTNGRVVYRVPAENFTAALDRVKREGTVIRSRTNTSDVTGQVADLNARLQNLRAQRNRTRTLYEQANDTEDVLAIGERLSSVQERIERLEARRQALTERVSYATLTVRLEEPTPTNDRPRAWYETGVVNAFLDAASGVVVAARATVVGTAYALPYLIAFGLPLLGLGALLRRWRD
ncbi:DUF4349 domain-containing protein [Halocatena pleomorpha]|uniref:DUF4349 domain-containing protein n=1 Tax=Halocatena pleomorpha TaxID=1785090 RepID=A0A3P3R9Z1_9EURY|nr:DUF4349 domain-containing protein [Halocatena pleomorpha]RRJ30286.1 DUF4349 domain-containing protein [Halocatena pleomorpha]